jgi:hypothetical protein
LPVIVGFLAIVRGAEIAFGAKGAGRLVVGCLLGLVGLGVLLIFWLYWSGFWWRRRHCH